MSKIDYVVPMVFPEDKQWQAGLRQVYGSTYKTGGAVVNARYRSWGTEHLLIRCVKKYMPWVHDIIILLACESQRQPWMDAEGVRVVYHRDFMPEQHLPTFNSRAMEMFLHRIPRLTERFLYGNDDMFPLSPLKETDFFVGSLPCQRFKVKDFPNTPNNFHRACLGGLNFVAGQFGKHFTHTWLKNGHSIAPILLDTCRYLWERFPTIIEGSVTPIRDARNFNQYIYGWHQHFSGNYIPTPPRRTYLSVKSSLDEIRRTIDRPDAGVVCINDNEYMDDITYYAKEVRKSMEGKLNNEL